MSKGFTRPQFHHSVLTAALLVAAVPAVGSAAELTPNSARISVNHAFSIARQTLASALNGFSTTTGWQVGLPAELAQDVISPGARGNLTPEQALDRLLAGTPLRYRKISANNVVLERSSPGAVIALQQMTVSATRQEQSANSVPSTVSVQGRTQLDRDNVNTLQDLVRYEPGVSAGGTGLRSGLTGYNIRGIDGDRVLTQVDGVEVPDSFFNGPYAQTERNYVAPEIVKRVEILRGPASSLYGSSAIGGVVSYYTLDPEDIIKPGKDVGARLKTGYSSADESWLNSATVAGRSGDVDALLHLSQRSGHETESYGDHTSTGLSRTAADPKDVRSTNVLAKLGWNYADDARFGLTYENYKDDRDVDLKSAYGGPYANGRPLNFYQSRGGNDTITRERFGLNHDFELDSVVADHIKWSLNYQIAKTDQHTEEHYVVPRARDVLRARDTFYKERQWVFDLQLDKAFELGQTDHLLTYGTNIRQQKVTGSRSGYGTCLTVMGSCRAIGADSAADRLVKSSDFPDPTINTYSLFAQDEIRWNQWTLRPSARYDYTQLKPRLTDEFLRTVNPTGEYTVADNDRNWHRLSPTLGVTYDFDDHYTWYGQYAEGFRTPSAKALYGRFENLGAGYTVQPNPDLEPEKSRSYETGLRGKFEAGTFDIAVFYNQYRDFINEDAVSPGATSAVFQSNNIKHATIKGVELKGRLNLDSFGAPQGLYSQGSIAYAHGKNEDNGQPINSVNPLKGVFGLGYEQQQYGGLLSWTLVKRQNRVDSSAFKSPDGSGVFKTPGFGILDLAGYYKVTDDVTVNAGLYNLTDKKYWLWDDVRSYDGVGEAAVTSPANLDRLTAPGRNFAINLVWDI
ncbi:TonB-dependent receptor [Pseudomonas sp. CFBP 13710]|uniref:TonB-dependent receptor n=1 Tax=Pseudomonas sp. CFBP 13710 TaxID=2775311 RepID=UPI001786F8BD|nr:TonB-dependent receptor [Pseudomonas sp. CFBP 13710]MBD8730519.1 TonB-dependent hemoglobin/transferrin/lactoferrin family receptor [Pseudomonas sp. CFBP 13710]